MLSSVMLQQNARSSSHHSVDMVSMPSYNRATTRPCLGMARSHDRVQARHTGHGVRQRQRRSQMAKYLLQGSYTVEGLRGVLREGGTKRREAVAQLVQALGGSLETFYYAYGGDDF